MNFQEVWDACAQNKTRKSQTINFQEFCAPVRRTRRGKSQKKVHFSELMGLLTRRAKRRKSKKTALSGILGPLCAQQNVRNLKKWIFRNCGTPVRRTRPRKSQKMQFQEFWDFQNALSLHQCGKKEYYRS